MPTNSNPYSRNRSDRQQPGAITLGKRGRLGRGAQVFTHGARGWSQCGPARHDISQRTPKVCSGSNSVMEVMSAARPLFHRKREVHRRSCYVAKVPLADSCSAINLRGVDMHFDWGGVAVPEQAISDRSAGLCLQRDRLRQRLRRPGRLLPIASGQHRAAARVHLSGRRHARLYQFKGLQEFAAENPLGRSRRLLPADRDGFRRPARWRGGSRPRTT
jgi:hypothetical protein